MITCPNCGNPVRETQQFCGNCGTDVHAALAASSTPAPAAEEPTAPYAYSQPASSGYGYEYQPPAPSAGGGNRMLIIGAAIVLVACCMFACGLVFGFEIIPDLLGLGGSAPKPVPSPTPVGWLPVIQFFIG